MELSFKIYCTLNTALLYCVNPTKYKSICNNSVQRRGISRMIQAPCVLNQPFRYHPIVLKLMKCTLPTVSTRIGSIAEANTHLSAWSNLIASSKVYWKILKNESWANQIWPELMVWAELMHLVWEKQWRNAKSERSRPSSASSDIISQIFIGHVSVYTNRNLKQKDTVSGCDGAPIQKQNIKS